MEMLRRSKSKKALIWALSIVFVMFILGTLGYAVFEKRSLPDAIYHTLNVISTLGASPPDSTREGRLVTIF